MAFGESTVRITGLKEFGEALRELPARLERGALRAGARAAAKVIQDGMSLRAPRDPHPSGITLADEIVVAASSLTNEVGGVGRVPMYKVGPSRRAFYGLFQEFGTIYAPAQPFMRPTIEADGQIAVAAWAVHAKAHFERSVRRGALAEDL